MEADYGFPACLRHLTSKILDRCHASGARKLLAANSAHIGLRFAGMAAHASGRAGDPAAAPCRQSPPRRHTPRNILTLAQVDSRSSLMTSRKSDRRVLLAIV